MIPSDMLPGSEHKTKRFGIVVIEEYLSSTDVKVKFVNTGWTTTTRSSHVRSGSITDKTAKTVCGFGFIGDGEFKPSSKGKHTDVYICWRDMIHRCYSESKKELLPTYSNCLVCDEWANFQNFAKWYSENYPSDGISYQLDKDILSGSRTGKLYSPSTCKFVSPQENTEYACATNSKLLSPSGEVVDIFNIRKFCRENGLNQGAISRVMSGKWISHKGWKRVYE